MSSRTLEREQLERYDERIAELKQIRREARRRLQKVAQERAEYISQLEALGINVEQLEGEGESHGRRERGPQSLDD